MLDYIKVTDLIFLTEVVQLNFMIGNVVYLRLAQLNFEPAKSTVFTFESESK
jgi:hypothetical protein